ncbi:MAG: hypothetical protein U1F37_16885 [Alphaproteobacteria bacterium]
MDVQHTDGAFRAVAAVDDDVYALVERAGSLFIERFDEALAATRALTGAVANAAPPEAPGRARTPRGAAPSPSSPTARRCRLRWRRAP